METVTASSILISVVCIVVVTGLVKALNWVWLRPKKLERCFRQQGIPGTSYKLLYGDMKDISSMKKQALINPINSFSNNFLQRVDPFAHLLVTEFGKDYFIWTGPTPMVNISKPELIRVALTKMQEFKKPKSNPLTDRFFTGLINYEGDKWAKHRKLINPAFHLEKLKLMLPAFYDSCAEMIDKWASMVAKSGSSELDVVPDLTTLSADVISRAAFGSSYEEGQKLFELLREQFNMALIMLQSVYIPGTRYIPTARNRRFKEVDYQIQGLLKRIINKRKREIEAGEPMKSDVLGTLMSNSTETQQTVESIKNQQLGMSIREVINECKLFYLAGQETTSLLLVWTLILLSKHQDWQARAREEVLQTFGNNAPDLEGLSHLKTMNMILYEVMRLYPPVTQLTRRICKDTKLGELSLPAGTNISIPILFVHHDKEIWGDDAEEFRPERFSEGISKATKGNTAYFPFSWGPRICIGEKFAMIEAKMGLSMMLQRFCFELSPNYVHAPISVMLLQPQHGAQIILHRLR